jgi:signal transduction histidine kinase
MNAADDQEMVRAGNATPAAATVPAAERRGGLRAGGVSFRAARASELVELARFEGEGRFAAYIAHELRSPLAAQRALLELALTDPLADTASWRIVAEDVLDACMEQERLLEACVALARSRCALTRHDPVDLAAITAEALRAHDLCGLESVVALEPAWTTGDPSLVERLAANLVSNAIRHNVVGGRIEVETRAESGRAVLMVANTGPLVPAADVPRLFQPFQRLNSNPRSFSDGVGLGLAIVQAIADVHDAIVTATARVGGGLEIHVSFPRPLKERRPRTQTGEQCPVCLS